MKAVVGCRAQKQRTTGQEEEAKASGGVFFFDDMPAGELVVEMFLEQV